MNIHFTEAVITYFNEQIESYNVPERNRFLALHVEDETADVVKHVIMDVIDEDWERIVVGSTHEVIEVPGAKFKVLARSDQKKYFDNLIVDYRIVESGEGVVVFFKLVD